MKEPKWNLGLLLAVALISGGLNAQPILLGDQFQVNTYTTMGQYSPSGGVTPSGDFVVT